MDYPLQTQIETYLSHLDALMRRGRELRDTLTSDSSDSYSMTAVRAWQEDCGVTVNQLSGGSKAHWLARSFSEAFLMRSADGRAVAGAAPTEIVTRLIGVLEQAVATLSGMGDSPDASGFAAASSEAPPPRRFEFVHDADLRPVVDASGLQTVGVGSSAVREFIDELQPVIGLHGHVHESPGATKLGRTVCLNPGSDYQDGVLRGAIVELDTEQGLRSWQLVQG